MPQKVGDFDLRGSVSAGFTGVIRANVTQVMVSSNRLEPDFRIRYFPS